MGINYMMKTLDEDRVKIGKSQYTLTLLAQGMRSGILQPQAVQRYQNESMEVLKKLIIKYTFGESSSVKVEEAESIMKSIYYVLDVYMASQKTPYESLAKLDQLGLQKVFEEGLDYLRDVVNASKELYEQVKVNSLEIDNIAYKDTLQGIGIFFQLYNVLFGAHDTMSNIDYPLAIDDMSIEGALYIKQYLEHLDIENRLCRKFDANDIERLLENYGASNKIDYREGLINIFEIVIENYVFVLMLGTSSRNLNITKEQYDDLVLRLEGLNDEEIGELVSLLFDVLTDQLDIIDQQEVHYLMCYHHKFLERLLMQRKTDLSKMIIMDCLQSNGNLHVIEDGQEMDDQDFKKLVENIIDCQSIEEKIDLIKSHMKSLKDFVDILEADCLFDDEYTRFYEHIGDMELAILGKITYQDILRLQEVSIAELEEQELDKPWQCYLDDFIKRLDDKRLAKIEHLINYYHIKG